MLKLNLLLFGLLSFSANVLAEDIDSDSVIVPLHDVSRPATIHVHLMSGGIKVRGEERKDIAIESHTHARESHPPADGMHRLETSGGGLDIQEENNVVSIKSDIFHQGGNITVVVPRRASLQLQALAGGEIEVDHVEGDIEVEDLNGSIRLKDVAGSVIAHSLNGEVYAELTRIDPSKPMSFSTMNGKIDVTLPADVKASVVMRTDNGEILSDFEVKLDQSRKSSDVDSGRRADGTFHLHLDKTVRGMINGGGPELKFRSFNGQIFIRKRK